MINIVVDCLAARGTDSGDSCSYLGQIVPAFVGAPWQGWGLASLQGIFRLLAIWWSEFGLFSLGFLSFFGEAF